jgi:hypothetical protein
MGEPTPNISRAVSLCPFAIDYISRHSEYLDLVHLEYRARVTAGA